MGTSRVAAAARRGCGGMPQGAGSLGRTARQPRGGGWGGVEAIGSGARRGVTLAARVGRGLATTTLRTVSPGKAAGATVAAGTRPQAPASSAQAPAGSFAVAWARVREPRASRQHACAFVRQQAVPWDPCRAIDIVPGSPWISISAASKVRTSGERIEQQCSAKSELCRRSRAVRSMPETGFHPAVRTVPRTGPSPSPPPPRGRAAARSSPANRAACARHA